MRPTRRGQGGAHSTPIYRLSYPTIPLSIAADEKNFACIEPSKKVILKFPPLHKQPKLVKKLAKNSNLKADALPHTSTDSTPIYSVYYPTSPLSIAGNKINFACNTPSKQITLIFLIPAKRAQNRPKIEKNSNLKVDALPYSSTDSTHFYRE